MNNPESGVNLDGERWDNRAEWIRKMFPENAERIIEVIEGTNPKLYPIATMEASVKTLRRLGFKDPVKMITSFPAILGYAEENIAGKLKIGQRVQKITGVDPIEFFEQYPTAIGYAPKRLLLILRNTLQVCDGDKDLFYSFLTQKPRVLTAALIHFSNEGKVPSRKEVRAILRRFSEADIPDAKTPTAEKLKRALERYLPR